MHGQNHIKDGEFIYQQSDGSVT